MKRAKLEICCGNINDVIAIKGLDFDRIELNSALELGGLTPTLNTLIKAKEICDKPIVCMVRSRGGDFIHTKDEIEVMYKDAEVLLNHGADGIVFGFLNEDISINIEALEKMRKICEGKELVFHKAFDVLKDKKEGLDILIKHGVNRILLMNEEGEDLFDAARRIGEYNDSYGDKIELLPGGGVTEDNILKILALTKANQVHGTFKEVVKRGNSSFIQVSRQRVKDTIDILSH